MIGLEAGDRITLIVNCTCHGELERIFIPNAIVTDYNEDGYIVVFYQVCVWKGQTVLLPMYNKVAQDDVGKAEDGGIYGYSPCHERPDGSLKMRRSG